MRTLLLKLFIIILAIVGVDQVTKYLAFKYLYNAQDSIVLIPKILSLTLTVNEGIAFGLFNNSTLLITLVTCIVICGILFYLIKNLNNIKRFELYCWAMIIAGAIGNFIDRATLGFVIDFIKLDFINFPIFNVADISINIGVLLLIISSFIKKD